jgi:hypothetical protein
VRPVTTPHLPLAAPSATSVGDVAMVSTDRNVLGNTGVMGVSAGGAGGVDATGVGGTGEAGVGWE